MHGLLLHHAQNAFKKGEHTLLQGTEHKALGNLTEQLSRVWSLRKKKKLNPHL